MILIINGIIILMTLMMTHQVLNITSLLGSGTVGYQRGQNPVEYGGYLFVRQSVPMSLPPGSYKASPGGWFSTLQFCWGTGTTDHVTAFEQPVSHLSLSNG